MTCGCGVDLGLSGPSSIVMVGTDTSSLSDQKLELGVSVADDGLELLLDDVKIFAMLVAAIACVFLLISRR